MRISVVTACRNSAGTVGATLESVAAQRVDGFEVEHLAVDGLSSDGTVGILEAFAAAHPGFSFVSEADRGLYDAINKGIARATGDVVGILNSDDVFDGEDALAAVAGAFADASVDAVYADIRFVNDDGSTRRYYSGRGWRPWMARWGYMMPHPSVYIRREVFARLGGYRTDFRISADFELMVRYFVKARLKTRYLDRSLVKMRPGGISTSGWRANVRLNRENVRALADNGIRSSFAMMLPKYAYKALGYLRGRVLRDSGVRARIGTSCLLFALLAAVSAFRVSAKDFDVRDFGAKGDAPPTNCRGFIFDATTEASWQAVSAAR